MPTYIITLFSSIYSWNLFLVKKMKEREIYHRLAREKLYETCDEKLGHQHILEGIDESEGSWYTSK